MSIAFINWIEDLLTDASRASLLGALIGLSRATENNEYKLRTETHLLILEGLGCLCPDFPSSLQKKNSPVLFQIADLSKLIERLHAEKYRLVPDCAVCASPCGRTFDYDLRQLNQEETEVRSVKLELLSGVIQLSTRFTSDSTASEPPAPFSLDNVSAFIYKALVCFGIEGLQPAFFQSLLDELTCFEKQ